MKTIPSSARTQNVAGIEYCRYCDGGWVVWDAGDPPGAYPCYGESFAPCPFCEKGHLVEFPVAKEENKPPPKPPWGRAGFWSRHDADMLEPRPRASAPLPPDESRTRLAELRQVLRWASRRMPE